MTYKSIFTLLSILLITLTTQAYACRCPNGTLTDATSQENIQNARYIISGAVQNIENPPPIDHMTDTIMAPSTSAYYSKVTINVDKVHKGEGQPRMLTVYAHTQSHCSYTHDTIKAQTFFLINELEGEYTLAGLCDGYVSAHDRERLILGASTSIGAGSQNGATDKLNEGLPAVK